MKFTLGLASVVTMPLATAAVLIAGAGSAQAAAGPTSGSGATPQVIQGVGLPYTMRVSGLSGGSDGVKSPVFATNSTGKLCFDPGLYNEHDANHTANDDNFRIEVYKDNSISDELQRTLQFNLISQPEECIYGLTTNHNYYIKVKKNAFREGQLMGGTVVISYT